MSSAKFTPKVLIHPVSKPEPAEVIPRLGVDSSLLAGAVHMPKRLSDAELDAALAAGEPPRSEEYSDDDVWHEKQNEWLERWQPGRALPPPEEKHRRTEWDKLTKQHARAFKVADDRRHQAPQAPSPAPRKRGAPRILTDEEREAAAIRHKQAKREHSRIRTVVHRQVREERQQAATAAYDARRAARQQLTLSREPARAVAQSRYGRCDTCQHVMCWQIPQRCMHCRMKDGSAPYNRWYASHSWGPFDEDGVCLCNCCQSTCRCVPCAERRGAECQRPLENARSSSPASLYGECDGETEREIEDGYDESASIPLPAVDHQLPAYAYDDWRAQQTAPVCIDPYESVPEYADVCI